MRKLNAEAASEVAVVRRASMVQAADAVGGAPVGQTLNDADGGGGVSISGLKLSATAAMFPLAACDAVGDVDEDATSGLQLPSTRSHHHRLHRSGTLDATVTMTISFQNRHEHLIFAVLVCPAALADASKHALIDCADDCECSILFTEYFRNLTNATTFF
jgi:hypothetical protein